jgi:hypothetical protein
MGNQLETRASAKERLFTLLSIEEGILPVKIAVSHAKSGMEKEDVESVLDEIRKLKEECANAQ